MDKNFNPRSLTGATLRSPYSPQQRKHFNPRSLAGATSSTSSTRASGEISIHAPLRERPRNSVVTKVPAHFNPRSLAGATLSGKSLEYAKNISIHAPLRERPGYNLFRSPTLEFQSTLPCGSDDKANDWAIRCVHISIHAPLRERHTICFSIIFFSNFNPRSLAGATPYDRVIIVDNDISIHAPLRERHLLDKRNHSRHEFQSTLPCGSDLDGEN